MNKGWLYCIGVLLLVVGCKPATKQPTAVKGILDLREWSFNQQHPKIVLNGEWAFFWQKHYAPTHISTSVPLYVKVPSSWNKYTINQTSLPDRGFATYYLKIVLDKAQINQPLALNIKVVQTAYRVYIQGKHIGGCGTPNTSAKTSKPDLQNKIYTFIPKTDTVDLVLQVACFEDNTGGLSRAIELGQADHLIQKHQYNRYYYDKLIMVDVLSKLASEIM